jgi:nucleotide-binding universal stress UspA family protein
MASAGRGHSFTGVYCKEIAMYTNVVVGMDGTDAGRAVLACAGALAPSPRQLTLVNVRVLDAPARGYIAAFDPEMRERSVQLLRAEQQRAPAAETLSVLAADVGTGLRHAAESRGADLMVVGSCHRSSVGRVFAGDDTRSALHGAPCAVAVAPRGYHESVKRPGLIGVAYDGSPDSEVALAHARALAKETGARVVARHVTQLRVYGAGGWAPAVVEDAEAQIARAREQLGELGDLDLSVVIGATGEELAAFSETVGVLVCGSRHNGIVKRVALGSTSDFLARDCACPLIITPAAVQTPELPDRNERLAMAEVGGA